MSNVCQYCGYQKVESNHDIYCDGAMGEMTKYRRKKKLEYNIHEEVEEERMSEQYVEVEVTEEEAKIVEWIMSKPLHLQFVRLLIENDDLKKRIQELEDMLQVKTNE